MLNFSFYDEIRHLLKTNKDYATNRRLENELSISELTKNNQQNKDMEKGEINQEKYSPFILSHRIQEDMPKLERYIKDEEYREKLQNSLYPYYSPELSDILGLQELVKKKIGIPENASIKYEKVKCSRYCTHEHEYFYAYYWDSTAKKLKKKYIGKELPKPFKFKITYSID